MNKHLFLQCLTSREAYKKTCTALLIAALVSGVVTPSKLFAESLNQTNPFTQGVGQVRLSLDEKKLLLQYALNAKSVLEEALEAGSQLQFTEKLELYKSKIADVVLRSHETKGTEELLMRIILNQALEMTVGLPERNGTFNQESLVLMGANSVSLITEILESSMRLATQYYVSDREAIDSGVFSSRPRISLALQKLALVQYWESLSLSNGSTLKVLRFGLQHFLNITISEQNLLQVTFAEEIVKANEVLEALDRDQGTPISNLIRRLRGVVEVIHSNGLAKLRSLDEQKRIAEAKERVRLELLRQEEQAEKRRQAALVQEQEAQRLAQIEERRKASLKPKPGGARTNSRAPKPAPKPKAPTSSRASQK